jgi:hypothetical protein
MAYLISDNLKRHSWDSMLRKEALTPDIYTDFAGVRDSDTPTSLPQGIMVKYTEKGGNTTHTLPLLKALQSDGGVGRDRAKGNEEDQVVASFQIYANSWFTTVSKSNYGVDSHESAYLNLLKQITPQLGDWVKERKGRYIREALCQVYSSNLTAVPVGVTQGINPNLAFIGGATTDVNLTIPTYDPTLATYVTNIQSSATAIGTPNSSNRLGIDQLNRIMEYATDTKVIKPVKVNGEDCYILTIPHRQKQFLMSDSTNTLFSLFKEADFRGKNRALNYEMHKYGSLLLVVDPRTPICTVTGGTVTFGYKDVGDNDGRNRTAGATNFDVCILHGNEAVYEYVAEPLHFEEDDDDYGRNGGIGAFQTSGFQLTQYDAQVPTATSITQQYSAVFLAGTL